MNLLHGQGPMNRRLQASKNFQLNGFGRDILILQGQSTFGDILVLNKSPSMSPNVFDVNDKIN